MLTGAKYYHAGKVRLQLISQKHERTFSSQVDAVVDGILLRVIVDNNTSIEFHVKWSIHDGAIVAHNIQTLVSSASPEMQQAFHLIHVNHNCVMFILYKSVIILILLPSGPVMPLTPSVWCPPPVLGVSSTKLPKFHTITKTQQSCPHSHMKQWIHWW